VRQPRVAVCVDLDDDVEVIRAVHRRCAQARGHLVVTAGPKAASVDHLIRTLLIRLHVLWRLPRALQRSRTALAVEDRAAAEWEISWALTRTGITSLWVLDADHADVFAWRWLRRTAECEDLRLILHMTTAPDTQLAAALSGCRVRDLNPNQLRALIPEPSGGTGRRFRG